MDKILNSWLVLFCAGGLPIRTCSSPRAGPQNGLCAGGATAGKPLLDSKTVPKYLCSMVSGPSGVRSRFCPVGCTSTDSGVAGSRYTFLLGSIAVPVYGNCLPKGNCRVADHRPEPNARVIKAAAWVSCGHNYQPIWRIRLRMIVL